MQQDSIQTFQYQHDFFIGVDSDGCVINSMDIKHKNSFGPLFAEYFGLEAIKPVVQETWEFVNLYSQMRGTNRFKALPLTMAFLKKRPEVLESGVELMVLDGLNAWFDRESKLGNPALEQAIQETGEEDLKIALAWSLAVNNSVGNLMSGIVPFAPAAKVLAELQGKADLVAVSQMPTETLLHEWNTHDLTRYMDLICGQEAGTKAELLSWPVQSKHYQENHILMVGDAPGDLAAAKSNGVLYYPILPGREDEAWERFFAEAADKFFEGSYAGDYEAALIDDFHACLPEHPPWKQIS